MFFRGGYLRDRGVGGSNPLAPTISSKIPNNFDRHARYASGMTGTHRVSCLRMLLLCHSKSRSASDGGPLVASAFRRNLQTRPPITDWRPFMTRFDVAFPPRRRSPAHSRTPLRTDSVALEADARMSAPHCPREEISMKSAETRAEDGRLDHTPRRRPST